MKLKAFSGIMLTVMLIGMLTLAFNIQPVKAEPRTWTVDDDEPADFSSIQEAINAASAGDTIYVCDGTYYEQVVVNKSVSLIGEDEIATVIITNETDPTVYISADKVTVSGFEIQNSDYGGIFLNQSSNSVVSENVITATDTIRVEGGSGNQISDNKVLGPYGCVFYGLILTNSDNNVVTGNYLGSDCHTALTLSNSHNNYIASNYLSNHLLYSVKMSGSNNNSIVGNTIDLLPIGGMGGHAYLAGSNGNVLYHNSFLVSGEGVGPVRIYVLDGSVNNTWDNGYPSGGNYWENYTSVDLYSGPYQNETGSDDIGDTPYIIDANNTDYYPLMNPWTPTETIIRVNGEDYPVTIVSNTTIDQISATANTLHFEASGSTGEKGYISVIFPMINTTEIEVLIDGEKLTPPYPVINTNGTHYYIYFEFTLSTHTIEIQFAPTPTPAVGGISIPVNKLELLAPYVGLTILLAVAVMTVVYVKKRKRNTEIIS